MNEMIKKKIEDILEKNEVCLFMKGTAEVPQCGFSLAVSNVLKHLKVNFKGINVLEDHDIREGIKEYSDWPTIPQLYVKKKINNELEKNEVCLFMKGSPEVPQCGFSLAVSNVLKHLKINFKGINVLENGELREGIKEYSDWPTIPQLYIKGEFIGGCDIVKEMFENGELQTKLKEKQISFKNKTN